MPIPTQMSDLSVTAASNSPAGTDPLSSVDDHLRALASIVRVEQAQAGSVASAATVDLGNVTSGAYLHITGTTTISSFGATGVAGISRTVVFDGELTLTHSASLILPGAVNITTVAGDAAVFRCEGAGVWRLISYATGGFTVTDLQTQGKTAVTSAGTAPNFTATTSPAYGALAAGQRVRVKFHAAGTTGSNTLNRDGLGAKNLMQYDATGTKVAAVIAASMLADVEYDGADWVVLTCWSDGGADSGGVFG